MMAENTRDGLEYRLLRDDEFSALDRFYDRHLDAAGLVSRLNAWRRGDPARSGGLQVAAAFADGSLVGAMNVVPVSLTCRGARLAGSWEQDGIVDSGMRGRGVGTGLLETAATHRQINLGKAMTDPMYRVMRNAGFGDVPNSEYLIRPLAPVSARQSRARNLLFPALWAHSRIRRLGHAATPLRTRVMDRFDDEFDRLADRRAAADELAPYKGSAYLNWRYRTCPVRDYRILRVERDGILRGAVVLRTNTEPKGDAWLVDLICDTRDPDAVHALLNATFAELKAADAGCVRTFASSERARRLLFKRGFVRTRETPRFTFRFERPQAVAGVPRRRWNFWHGDGDAELYH